jgi:hypothetical protein
MNAAPAADASHIWMKNDNEIKNYFKFNNKYICTTCELIINDFNTFKTQHRHAVDFKDSKKLLFNNIHQKSGGDVSATLTNNNNNNNTNTTTTTTTIGSSVSLHF